MPMLWSQISPCRPRKQILLNFFLGLSGHCHHAPAKASSSTPQIFIHPWLIACRSGISKISVLKDIYLENRFIHNRLEAILFEEMRRIDLLLEFVKYTASLL
jgi:hypothetical protein